MIGIPRARDPENLAAPANGGQQIAKLQGRRQKLMVGRCACTGHELHTAVRSGLLRPGQSCSHTFTSAGEYFYNDFAWPHITGKIVVQ